MSTPIIVCPLEHERKALMRAGVPGRLICIGPGAGGVERLASMLGAVTGPVILAGVAGAIDDSCEMGAGYVIRNVIGSNGQRWQPNWPAPANGLQASIATSETILIDESAKRRFCAQTGAQLVDQESEPFAQLASHRNWQWGIVRGVSDDVTTSLPPDIHNWVTGDGRTRLSRTLVSCFLRPTQIRSLLALHKRTEQALLAVARILRRSAEAS